MSHVFPVVGMWVYGVVFNGLRTACTTSLRHTPFAVKAVAHGEPLAKLSFAIAIHVESVHAHLVWDTGYNSATSTSPLLLLLLYRVAQSNLAAIPPSVIEPGNYRLKTTVLFPLSFLPHHHHQPSRKKADKRTHQRPAIAARAFV